MLGSIQKSLANSKSIYWVGGGFAILNAILIAFEFYYAPILPVLLFVMLLAFFALDKLILFIVFLTPLSVNLTDIGLGVGLTLPTDPLLFGVLLIFILKLFAEQKFDKGVANHPVTLAIIINLTWIAVTTITSEMPFVSFKYLVSRLWYVTAFFFVMTQLTYARVKTLFEVTNDNPCECSEWNCVCDDKTDVDSACYFPHVFTKWDRIKQMDGVVTYIQRRQRLTSDGYSLFTFDPLTPFDFSHNKDPGTRMYWNMIGANCGLNEKFVFPYYSDMEQELEPHTDIWFYTYRGVRCVEPPTLKMWGGGGGGGVISFEVKRSFGGDLIKGNVVNN